MHLERGARLRRDRRKIIWYIRIGTYALILAVAFFAVNNLRGKIPMMFGVTPVRMDPLTVRRTPRPGGSEMADVSVTVRIVGRDSVPDGLRLAQFRLRSDADREYKPYGSSFSFDRARGLRIAEGDTLIGAFFFALPTDEMPEELWWQP